MKILSIAIMAHPSREEWVKGLLAELGDVPVSWDRGDGIWANCRRAWLLYDPEAVWHLVLQDDAVLCSRFEERARQFLLGQASLSQAVSFYFGKTRMEPEERALAKERGIIVRDWLGWGLAVCLPTSMINDMIASGDGDAYLDKEGRPYPDDTRIARFLKKRGILTVYPIPSLVDHRPGPSLVGDSGKGRRAWRFLRNG